MQVRWRVFDTPPLRNIMNKATPCRRKYRLHFSNQESGEIELMNRLVQKKPSAFCQVLFWWRARIATNCTKLIDATQQSSGNSFPGFRIAGIKSSLESDLKGNSAFLHHPESLPRSLQIKGNWFFAKDSFVRTSPLIDQQRMTIGRSTHDDA